MHRFHHGPADRQQRPCGIETALPYFCANRTIRRAIHAAVKAAVLLRRESSGFVARRCLPSVSRSACAMKTTVFRFGYSNRMLSPLSLLVAGFLQETPQLFALFPGFQSIFSQKL